MGNEKRLELFPRSTQVTTDGSALTVAGCDLNALATAYGTPLYLYDQATMDSAAAAYRQALAQYYPAAAGVTYAGKAFLCTAVAQWVQRQGFWLDCTGAGELHVAAAAGLPHAQILVHGVNKSPDDLIAAVAQAGVLVVDNLPELHRLIPLLQAGTIPPALWIRVRPGVAVDTHAYRQTGQEDSKFGMGIAEAAQALALCQQAKLTVTGLHFHQGSHFHDPEPIAPALDTVLDLIVALRDQLGWTPQVLCPGGGWGVAYHEADLPHPTIGAYVHFVARYLAAGCAARQLPLPRLQLEPGRSLVAQAGVALYRVGAIKTTAARRWLMIDGGLADNPRPALYGARYSALPVQSPLRPNAGATWFAGPFCESGDILIEDLPMPAVAAGELVAVPVAGAYQLAMGSNYNGACKPAVLWLNDGEARLIRRRETVADLVARDLPLF
ncbi:MAG: diaminopimelate decarboxylase [Caldilineaceae bacterium]|nr:diaminopimelate decarboxylase [Caldilineaceae bacterium]